MTARVARPRQPDQAALGDDDLAELAGAIAEPARAAILLVLTDGRALPASVLAAEAGVAPSTASAHLSRLLDAGLVRCRPQGRHRYYELAGPQVGELVKAMARLAPLRPIRSLRQATCAAALRDARTCYNHLAGHVGGRPVCRSDRLRRRHRRRRPAPRRSATHDRLSAPGRNVTYRLTATGRSHLLDLGADLAQPNPDGSTALRYCVDWTEQRHHLAGAVGTAVASTLLARGWITRAARGRAVHLTDAGHTALTDHGLIQRRDDVPWRDRQPDKIFCLPQPVRYASRATSDTLLSGDGDGDGG